jgi:small-conductance mechanosensitive channel
MNFFDRKTWGLGMMMFGSFLAGMGFTSLLLGIWAKTTTKYVIRKTV